jgi:hypothetical protein
MLTGTHPFRRKVAFSRDDSVTALAVGSGPNRPQLSAAVAAFFGTALSTEPALRPVDALAFLCACEQALV